MKQLCMAVMLTAIFASCKKDKDEFVPTTVTNANVNIGYNKNMGPNSANWFSATTMKAMSLPEISKEPGLHEGIVFGFYSEGETYGFYSTDIFPKVYGQENWSTRRTVVFRKSTISFQQMVDLYDKYQENIPVQEIMNAWKNGINEKKQITNLQEGEVWMFRTTDEKITGLLFIQSVNSFLDKIQAMIWVAK